MESKLGLLLKKNNITQQDLAIKLDINRGYIGKLISGKIERIEISTLRKLALFFKKDINEFLSFSDEIENDIEKG